MWCDYCGNQASKWISKEKTGCVFISVFFWIFSIEMCDVVNHRLNAFNFATSSIRIAKSFLVHSAKFKSQVGEQMAKIRIIYYWASISMYEKDYSFSLDALGYFLSVAREIFVIYWVGAWPLKLFKINIFVLIFPVFKSHLVSIFILNILPLKISANCTQNYPPPPTWQFWILLTMIMMVLIYIVNHAFEVFKDADWV